MFRLIIISTIIVAVACTAVDFIPRLDGRIIGGSPTFIQKYPHQVSLRYHYSHTCGGSLYKENVVITAAHCVYRKMAYQFTVYAGSTYLSSGIPKSVKEIRQHPRYNPSTFENDIAIMILSDGFQFNDSIKPIELIDRTPIPAQDCEVSGWGVTSEGSSSTSQTLQFVAVKVVDQAECKRSYGYSKIKENMICAGHRRGGKDACQGDSGGPLIADGKLIGVVSWGYGCGRPNYPGIYANVFHFRQWILDNSK